MVRFWSQGMHERCHGCQKSAGTSGGEKDEVGQATKRCAKTPDAGSSTQFVIEKERHTEREGSNEAGNKKSLQNLEHTRIE